MSKTNTKSVGRPQTVRPIIRKHSLLFISRTPKEITEILFPEAQAKMRDGVTNDPKKIRAQKVSLYQQVLKYKAEALVDGKGINFRGRMVGGVKKMKWIHSKKKDQ